MLDNIIVAVIVVIAVYFVARRLFRQLTSKETACNCSGCGQAGSCPAKKNGPDGSDGPDEPDRCELR
ncbi:MAG: FeoB-associated Cys-rich membrane protein [Desulfovibrionaceae bacterium]|nr:FeoB-associated Cys-rich membrane protein [Desulfovibrionaceae bacterium]